MAAGFTQFVFKRLVFRLVTTTTTGTIGNWMLTVLWDSLDSVFTSKQELLDYGGAKEANVWKDVIFYCDKKAMHYFNKFFNYVNGGVPENADPKTYNVGQLVVATSGNSTDTAIVGELHVDYEVDMMTPNIQGTLSTFDAGYWSFASNQGSTAFLVPHSNNNGVTLQGISNSSFALSFLHYGNGQEYMVLWQYLMTTYTAGHIAFGGCTVTGGHLVNTDGATSSTTSSDWNNGSAGQKGVMSFCYLVPTSSTVTFSSITNDCTGTIGTQVLLVSPVTPNNLSFYPMSYGRNYAIREGKVLYNLPHRRHASARVINDLKHVLRAPIMSRDPLVLPPVSGRDGDLSAAEIHEEMDILCHTGNALARGDPRHLILAGLFPQTSLFYDVDWSDYVSRGGEASDVKVRIMPGQSHHLSDGSSFALSRSLLADRKQYQAESAGPLPGLSDEEYDSVADAVEQQLLKPVVNPTPSLGRSLMPLQDPGLRNSSPSRRK